MANGIIKCTGTSWLSQQLIASYEVGRRRVPVPCWLSRIAEGEIEHGQSEARRRRYGRADHAFILVFRGHKVLLDEDLATLYGVATGVLVQAVKRNIRRFPADFMFQLTDAEWTVLRSRIVISSPGHGGRRYAPYVFTEQGVAMLSSVLGSEHAIAVNIEIMRTFVKLRELLVSNKELARRFAQIEERLDKKLTEHDRAIGAILSAIRELMHPKAPVPKRRPIGFTADLEGKP